MRAVAVRVLKKACCATQRTLSNHHHSVASTMVFVARTVVPKTGKVRLAHQSCQPAGDPPGDHKRDRSRPSLDESARAPGATQCSHLRGTPPKSDGRPHGSGASLCANACGDGATDPPATARRTAVTGTRAAEHSPSMPIRTDLKLGRNLFSGGYSAGQGTIDRGNPHVVAGEEQVLSVPSESAPHLGDGPKHARRPHAHSLPPTVHAGEYPLVVSGKRRIWRRVAACIAKEAALDFPIFQRASSGLVAAASPRVLNSPATSSR